MKEMIEKIKKILFEEEKQEAAVEQKFMDITDKDGNQIHIVTAVEGEITVGDVVTGVEDGEYTIPELNKILVVTDEKVAEIKDIPAEETPEAPEEEMAAEEKPNEVEILNEKINDLEEKMNDFMSKFSAVKELIEKVAEQPASAPVKPEKTGFQKSKEERASKMDEKLNELRKYRV